MRRRQINMMRAAEKAARVEQPKAEHPKRKRGRLRKVKPDADAQ